MSEGIGAPVKRKEDKRFTTGKGKYTDDIRMENQAYAAFVRSPHAHARVKSIDTSAAENMEGVIAIHNGAELTGDGIGNIICFCTCRSRMIDHAFHHLRSNNDRFCCLITFINHHFLRHWHLFHHYLNT